MAQKYLTGKLTVKRFLQNSLLDKAVVRRQLTMKLKVFNHFYRPERGYHVISSPKRVLPVMFKNQGHDPEVFICILLTLRQDI